MLDQRILEQRLQEQVGFFCVTQNRLINVVKKFLLEMRSKDDVPFTVFARNDKDGIVSETFSHSFRFSNNKIIGKNTKSFFIGKPKNGTILKFEIPNQISICFVCRMEDIHHIDKTMELVFDICSVHIEQNKDKICEIQIPVPAPQS